MTIRLNKNLIYNINWRKRVILAVLLLLVLILLLGCNSKYVSAESKENDIEIEISQVVNDIIGGINLGELEDIVQDIDNLRLFEGSVKDKIISIVSGEYFSNYSNLLKGLMMLVVGDIRGFLPFFLSILAVGILASMMTDLRIDNNSSVGDIVHFACFGIMITTILIVFKDVLSYTSNTLDLILRQIHIIFPILITLLTSIGSLTSISIFNPLVAVLSTVVSIVFDKLLYPMFILMFILSILGNLTNSLKLDKMQGFLSSSFKWIVGIIFTLFSGFLTIQGITAGKFDGVSIKATKFAVKSYIPIIGSYIADGMDFIALGSVLVKNTIGLVGILILFITIISPIIMILTLKLGLQLTSAVLEMSGADKMSNFVSMCAKILIYPIVLILGVSFMYIITIALIMCTANIF